MILPPRQRATFLLLIALIISPSAAVAIDAEASEIFFRGNQLFDAGEYEAALASYDAVLRIDRGYAEAWANRGAALYQLNRHSAALRSFSRAVDLSPDLVIAWEGLGNVCAALDNPEEAAACYREVITLDPTAASAWAALGDALLELGMYQESQRAYEEAIALDRSYARIPFRDKDKTVRVEELTSPGDVSLLNRMLPVSVQAPIAAHWAIIAVFVIMVSGKGRLKR
ncbi:tetratricopeptide (TPR) repeat protein [Methanocalculus alkaliphilus]|uniref:tetratricopeptide repeat protein n=1 Tax=Methanocalculus alkaliphilus TaxID=768730 RepID=UPI0020A184E1|nr:tetratricopeptide repeat protein [Methanocalculus alkaliphilus]MCP1715274.1 tetratricopeptide (TPR) repeat protein [Methanocalculus alkaliphilus]